MFLELLHRMEVVPGDIAVCVQLPGTHVFVGLMLSKRSLRKPLHKASSETFRCPGLSGPKGHVRFRSPAEPGSH